MVRELPSIRRVLVWMSAASILPAALLAAWLVSTHFQRERQLTQAHAIASARAVAAAVDDRVRSAQAEVAQLALSPRLKAGDLRAFQEEALMRQRTEGLLALALLSNSGLAMHTAVPFGAPLPNRNIPPILGRPMDTGQTVVSGVYVSPVLQRPVVSVGVPAFGPSDAPYALTAMIDAGQLRSLLERQKMPPTWITAIVDADGAIIARSHEQERFATQVARGGLRDRLKAQPEGAVESVTLDGVPVVSAFSRSPLSGWAVVVGMPRDELEASVHRDLLVIGAAATVLLGLALFGGWLLGSRLARSVEDLTAASRAMVHGARFQAPHASFLEAEQLGYAFEAASAAIGDATEAAEQRAARLDAILDSALDAIIATGSDGRIQLFNRMAEQMFGMAREDAIGLSIDVFIPRRFRAEHAESMQAFAIRAEMLGGAAGRMMAAGRVVPALRADGTEIRVEASISFTVEGGRQLFTVILRDVDEQLRHIEALNAASRG
jgi:PAS domain S-box-containing protein